ncbi:MAG: hypothetical protein F4X65_08975 [Chloroflexi bacterium]|nr:hypothetical protein [Chloroflexota bacterium]
MGFTLDMLGVPDHQGNVIAPGAVGEQTAPVFWADGTPLGRTQESENGAAVEVDFELSDPRLRPEDCDLNLPFVSESSEWDSDAGLLQIRKARVDCVDLSIIEAKPLR